MQITIEIRDSLAKELNSFIEREVVKGRGSVRKEILNVIIEDGLEEARKHARRLDRQEKLFDKYLWSEDL